MGIIGVVAALTLPNLNSSTGDKEKVAKLQKIYSNLEDALGRAQAVYGPINEWFVLDNNDMGLVNKRFRNRLLEFMKVSSSIPENTGSWITLADGSSMTFSYAIMTTNCNDTQSCGYMEIDIDGVNKGKNKKNIDIFQFSLYPRGFEPMGSQKQFNNEQFKNNCLKGQEKFPMAYCTGWVIQNGNMDYLKVNSEGKCPDNKTILDWTTNTSCNNLLYFYSCFG